MMNWFARLRWARIFWWRIRARGLGRDRDQAIAEIAQGMRQAAQRE